MGNGEWWEGIGVKVRGNEGDREEKREGLEEDDQGKKNKLRH